MQTESPINTRHFPPAQSLEEREDQLILLATDLAEKWMREGTAPAQVVSHYLKLGSTSERLEKELKEKQKQLMEAKTESYKSAERIEELYTKAIQAMAEYNGQASDYDDVEFLDL